MCPNCFWIDVFDLCVRPDDGAVAPLRPWVGDRTQLTISAQSAGRTRESNTTIVCFAVQPERSVSVRGHTTSKIQILLCPFLCVLCVSTPNVFIQTRSECFFHVMSERFYVAGRICGFTLVFEFGLKNTIAGTRLHVFGREGSW